MSPFDKVCLVNLTRRSDRLTAFTQRGFPLPWERFAATEGDPIVPPSFTAGGGAWGCLRAHCNLLERAIISGVDSLLVLEDDVIWKDTFLADLNTFLDHVPDDWEMLMLGGQHHSDPQPVNEHCVRCVNTQRTHGYAVRGEYKKRLLHLWYSTNSHIDWILGSTMGSWKVYAPTKFLLGQSQGKSDISGRDDHNRWWVANPSNTVVHLTCPLEVVDSCPEFHRGHDRVGGVDVGLRKAVAEEYPNHAILSWFTSVNNECEAGQFPCVWGVDLSPEKLKNLVDKVVVIEASTREEAIDKLQFNTAIQAAGNTPDRIA